MPRISSFHGIVIRMYYGDHGHPHFHADHVDGAVKVRIDSLGVIEGVMPRRQLRMVLAWAEIHQRELLDNWQNAREGATLRSIEPLR